MFRACISSGKALHIPAFHPKSHKFYQHNSSATLGSQATKRKGLRNKKINIRNTEKRLKEQEANRPSVVLGTRPSEEETKWKNCYLAKVLVNEEELTSTTELHPTQFSAGTINLPSQLGFGVDEAEKEMLFDDLPRVTAELEKVNRKIETVAMDRRMQSERLWAGRKEETDDEIVDKEVRKANLFAKALDLRNANAAGIAFENRRRIIMAFSTPENPFDTGRTEVQAALLTYKIRKLWNHLVTFKRDVGNRRALRQLIHDRAKLLRYLKGKDRDRYETVLERLALEPEAVEGELVV
ncbi:hypothetical protein CVT26_015824 [Gymnopilus dilepis]|uniref:30S ribosomal protein S15 n=1 Tax=Gymnopilus dilepis TaxID=231916 RepID=A0A409W4L5_9AGAR|nr:hypothetical protein CVT26_015824 [Gymnopilus dilepis]